MEEERRLPGSNDDRNINDIRQQSLIIDFEGSIGQRILVLIESYPFFYVGRLTKVESDTIFIHVEFGNVPELDNVTLGTHVDNIQVYFVETPQFPIPDLRV